MHRAATVVLAFAAAASLVGAGPALAAGHAGHEQRTGTHSRHIASHAPKKAHHTKPEKAHDLTLTGVLVSRDAAASTVTVAVKGGTRALHGKTVTVHVGPKTVVRRNDRAATVADLQAGDHVSLKARRDAAGDTLTAGRINADSESSEPSPTASPSSSASSETAASHPSPSSSTGSSSATSSTDSPSSIASPATTASASSPS